MYKSHKYILLNKFISPLIYFILLCFYAYPIKSELLNTLTEEEKKWLKEHPVIKVAFDPEWAPIEFFDDKGNPQGASYEYLQMYEDMLDIKFQFQHNKTWDELVLMLKRKELDIASAITDNDDRRKYLTFTKPYSNFFVGIYSKNDTKYIGSIKELKNKQVAVVKEYFIHLYIKSNFPELNLLEVNTIEEGLKLVESGSAYAFIDAGLVTGWYISKLGYNDIKMTGIAPISYNLAIGVRNDWQIFVNILNQAIDAIPEAKKEYIYNKWVAHREYPGFDFSLIWKISAGIAVIVSFILLWNFRLRKEIKARKAVEAELLQYQGHLQELVDERTNNLNEALVQLQDSNVELTALNDELIQKSFRIEMLNENLEKEISTKNRFFSIIAHDLRNPMTVLVSGTDLLTNYYDRLTEEQKIKRLTIIRETSINTVQLLENLLTWARSHNSDIDYKPAAYSLNELLTGCIEVIKHQADLKEIQISTNYHPDIMVICDFDMVQTVVRNLLSNSIKYTPRTGIIEIGAYPNENNKTEFIIYIADNGVGMDEVTISKLFRIDEKVSTKGTDGEPSTGLGLLICKEFIEKHNQKIWAESELGKGSIFKFTLKTE